MKKFVFTLQSWYDMQLSIEKQQKLELKNIETDLLKRHKELEQMNAEFDKASGEYCSAVSNGVMAPRVKDYGLFFDSLKASMTTVQLEIGRLERERELRMQKLVHTRKEIKLLDKLREKQYTEYQGNAKKQHDKFVDDLVSYKVTIS